MSDEITPDRLDEIAARAAAATEGPWDLYLMFDDDGVTKKWTPAHSGISILSTIQDGDTAYAVAFKDDDARFIAHARQDVPDLITEIRRLRTALAECESLLHEAETGAVEQASEIEDQAAEIERREKAVAWLAEQFGQFRATNSACINHEKMLAGCQYECPSCWREAAEKAVKEQA